MTTTCSAASVDRRGRAIALILLAMLAFALQDMVVKFVAEQVSIWQLQAVRSASVLVVIAAATAITGRLVRLHPGPPGWPLLRAGFMALAYLLFYASLPMLALSQAAAAFYMGPLFITLLAALLLGEPIGPRRIGAVCLGFAGVLLIVRPWGATWEPWALMPLAASFCYAMGIVVTRWRCHDRPGLALTLVHNTLYTTIGLLGLMLVPLLPVAPEAREEMPFLLSGWLPLGAVALVLMLSTAGSHLVGMLSSIRAYQGEEASRLAPFEYSYLLVVPVLDVIGWGVLPDARTLAGMALIGCAGVFVAMREGRRARPTILPQSRPSRAARRVPGMQEQADGSRRNGRHPTR